MTFDLRVPIGLLLAVFGAILAIDGLVVHRLVLDINVNLWWGLVMIVFAAIMLGLSSRAKPAPHRAVDHSGDAPRRGH